MRAAVAIASFFLFVLLARRWSGAELGEFSTLFAFFLILQQAPLLGLHVPLMRELAASPQSLSEIGPSIAAIGVSAGALLGAGLGLAGVRFYPPSMHASFWLLGASLVPSALILVGESVLLARERLDRVAVITVAESLVRSGLWLLVVTFGAGLTSLFLILTTLRVLTLLVYYSHRDLRSVLRIWRGKPQTIARLLALAPTFAGILLLAGGINRLDFITLSRLGTMEQVGQYSAPYKIYETALMVPSVLALTLFPAFARAFAASGPGFEALVRQFLRACLTVGLPCAIALGFSAAPLVVGLFGPEFEMAAVVLATLAIVPVLVAADQALTMALLAAGHEQLDLRVLACACALYLLALAALIPSAGIEGAAIATLATAIVQMTLRYGAVRRRLGLAGMGGLVARPLLAGALMAAAIWAARPLALPVALAAGVAVYALTLTALRAVTADDVHWLLGALQRPREAA